MPTLDLNFRFSSATAQAFYFCGKRNIGWNSGFGAGKTYTASQKLVTLLTKFPGYRVAIGRYSATALKKTTMQTFFKVCPEFLYDPAYGGKRVDAQIPYLDLVNGSRVYWIHLDEFDETSLRSLEINACLIDQAEEIKESTYIELDNRVGRWDEVTVPDDLLAQYPNWPRNDFTGKPLAPAYNISLFNPPDEGEFSWLYERFHPDSEVHQSKFSRTYAYFQSSSVENKALPKENLEALLSRDEEWQHRFVHGNFGRGEGAIHLISPKSILDVDEEWVREKLLKKGSLARVLDHGATAPTCCLWFAAINGIYFCYREYYRPEDIVSVHRRNISDLSFGEEYSLNLADPSIFRRESEKYGGFWSVADEYSDVHNSSDLADVPPLYWSPADNNEFATRNRINELLKCNPLVPHPVTGELGSPRLYFIKRNASNPQGCEHVIKQLGSQKKKLLAEINGKKVYCDDRDDKVTDHAYDPLRYYTASHLGMPKEPKQKAKPNTFKAAMDRIRALKILSEQNGANF